LFGVPSIAVIEPGLVPFQSIRHPSEERRTTKPRDEFHFRTHAEPTAQTVPGAGTVTSLKPSISGNLAASVHARP